MQDLLRQYAEHRKARPDLILSRSEINTVLGDRAVTSKADLASKLAPELVRYQAERTKLIDDLLNDPVFQELLEGGEVTYGMIKPHANRAKTTPKTDDRVAEEVAAAISWPLTPDVVEHMWMPPDHARGFYSHLKDLPDSNIFPRVTEFMSGGASTGMIILSTGPGAIAEWRRQIGPTNPKNPDAHGHFDRSIRHRFADSMENNVVHGSDSVSNVRRELQLFRSLLLDASVLPS